MKSKYSLSVLITIFLLSANSYPQDLKGNDNLRGRSHFSATKAKTVKSHQTAFQKTTEGVIIYVPTDYQIIQDAIDASAHGDTIIIEEGLYNQQLKFNSKSIAVGSRYLLDSDTTHISKTILDGSNFGFLDSASIVYFDNGEDYTSVLCGLTLQNGFGTYGQGYGIDWRSGGAVSIYGSGATIINNIIKNNKCDSPAWLISGGGIDCFDVSSDKKIIIRDNIIYNNKLIGGVRALGGAIECESISSDLIIEGNKIMGNSILTQDIGDGGGISIINCNSSNINIVNNTVQDNTAEAENTYGGGIHLGNVKVYVGNNLIRNNHSLGSGSETTGNGGGISILFGDDNPVPEQKAVIHNNTIVENSAITNGGGVYSRKIETETQNNIIRSNNAPIESQLQFDEMPVAPIVIYSNIEGNYAGTGNIDEDPLFCDSSYCFLTNDSSPCIDAGNPDMIYNDIINGSTAYFPAMGNARNDMGVYGGPNSKWWQNVWWDPVLDVDEQFELNPEGFSIAQNYPNPFNPSTKIKYSILEQSKVTLKVFDVLGSEVSTLVNEIKEPGSYKVEFDATDLPSGVYFYRLQAGSFVETKKMLLLK